MSLDSVIDAPTWTFEYGDLPEMDEAIGAVTESFGERPGAVTGIEVLLEVAHGFVGGFEEAKGLWFQS